MDNASLNEARIKELLTAILLPIRANYQAGPISRDRCFEALNALAAATALVIAGAAKSDPTAGEAQAKNFFLGALEANKNIHQQL